MTSPEQKILEYTVIESASSNDTQSHPMEGIFIGCDDDLTSLFNDDSVPSSPSIIDPVTSALMEVPIPCDADVTTYTESLISVPIISNDDSVASPPSTIDPVTSAFMEVPIPCDADVTTYAESLPSVPIIFTDNTDEESLISVPIITPSTITTDRDVDVAVPNAVCGANKRPRRAAAILATARVQEVLTWERCGESSAMFTGVAEIINGEFDRASKGKKSKRAIEDVDVDGVVATPHVAVNISVPADSDDEAMEVNSEVDDDEDDDDEDNGSLASFIVDDEYVSAPTSPVHSKAGSVVSSSDGEQGSGTEYDSDEDDSDYDDTVVCMDDSDIDVDDVEDDEASAEDDQKVEVGTVCAEATQFDGGPAVTDEMCKIEAMQFDGGSAVMDEVCKIEATLCDGGSDATDEVGTITIGAQFDGDSAAMDGEWL